MPWPPVHRAFRPSGVGALVGLSALYASFGPALIPRPWLIQALVAGVSGALGYAVGSLLARLVHALGRWLGIRVTVAERTRRWVRRLTLVVLVLSLPTVWWWSLRWHRWTAELVGMPPHTPLEHIESLVLSALVAVVLVIAAISLAWAVRLLGRPLDRLLPRPVAYVASFVLVVALLVWATNAYLVRGTLEAFARSATALNNTTPAGLHPPSSPFRSGSPLAAQPWEDLGHFGQQFVSRGPDAEQIAAVMGGEAVDPVRVYAGLDGAGGIEEVADLALEEMERTGALDREVLVLVTTTGNGWIDEYNVAAVEYLTRGDSATVAMQYSYLPSPVAFVTDWNSPQRAGRLLLERVEALIAARPEAERPRLYVAGESLGAFGGQAAFSSAGDLLGRVDGAVWIGSPSFTPLWREVTASRHRASPQVAPVVDSGRHIRFMSLPQNLQRDVYGREYGPWEHPRVVYLQHPSDPIVWWNPSVAVSEPTWVAERAGHDVNPRLRWWPLVTFWQLVGDMPVSVDATSGHGHVYEDEMVPVWAAVLDVPGDRTAQITAAIRNSL